MNKFNCKLLRDIGDLWAVVLDMVAFYHQCCYNCQPRDDGEYVWLSTEHEMDEVLFDLIPDVCENNSHKLKTKLTHESINEALGEEPFACPNCGTEITDVFCTIGGDWLVRSGQDTNSASFLLSKTHWPYLTHYTKGNRRLGLRGLEILDKIINEKTIKSSSFLNQGKHNVVCFTECSPLEVLKLIEATKLTVEKRPYKDSFVGWKRSNHAICIRRSALISYGARPVLHGEPEMYKLLPKLIQWRYQKIDYSTKPIDWTFEREFRFLGDIDLNDFSPLDILVIVKNRREQFNLLAQKNVFPFPVMPMDYVYSDENPYPKKTPRQKELFSRIINNK